MLLFSRERDVKDTFSASNPDENVLPICVDDYKPWTLLGGVTVAVFGSEPVPTEIRAGGRTVDYTWTAASNLANNSATDRGRGLVGVTYNEGGVFPTTGQHPGSDLAGVTRCFAELLKRV
jgi:hypothetical protein